MVFATLASVQVTHLKRDEQIIFYASSAQKFSELDFSFWVRLFTEQLSLLGL